LEKVYVCHGGNKVGKMATEAIVERKGRILIPKEIREKNRFTSWKKG
jgi:hypothetical protein